MLDQDGETHTKLAVYQGATVETLTQLQALGFDAPVSGDMLALATIAKNTQGKTRLAIARNPKRR